MKAYHGLSKKIANALLLFPVLLSLGCANLAETLFTEQEYVLIDQEISEKPVSHGFVYSIPERAKIHKIVLLGTGKVQNYEISVRDEWNNWKLVKRIKRAIEFPFEIAPLRVETDAIRVSHYTIVGRGRVDTIQLYTSAEKYPQKQ